jgi:hypothetical protein
MVNTGNTGEDVPQIYATAVEVDGLRRTLDKFMKDQETQNNSINNSLEKLLKLAEISGAKLQDTTPEDKGSNTKGKNTSASYQIPQLRKQDTYRADPYMQKRVNFAASSSNLAQKQFTHQYSSQYQPWSQDAQLDDDQYTEFGEVPYYDLEQDEDEHPWNLQDHEEPFTKSTNIPTSNPTLNSPPNYYNPTHNSSHPITHTNNNPKYTTSNHQPFRERQHQPVSHY